MKIIIPNKPFSHDDKVTIRLFRQFARANDIKMDVLYENIGTFVKLYSDCASIGDLYLFCGRRRSATLTLKDLVLSQLWRFHVYANLKYYNTDMKYKLKSNLTSAIKTNGHRDDKRLKKLFTKHFRMHFDK